MLSIYHFDAAFNYIQSIDLYGRLFNNHGNFICVSDCEGGHKGASFEIPLECSDIAAQIIEGGFISVWDDGFPVYGGRITSKNANDTGWYILCDGIGKIFGNIVADHTYTYCTTSDVLTDLVGNLLDGTELQMSTDTSNINTSTYVLAGDQPFTKTTIRALIERYNGYEGWYYGAFMNRSEPNPKLCKPIYHYWPPSEETSLIIDARTLIGEVTYQPEFSMYGNQIRVYYGMGGTAACVDVNGKLCTESIPYDWDDQSNNTTSPPLANYIIVPSHGYNTGDAVRFGPGIGILQDTPLTLDVTYYVIYGDVDTIQLAASYDDAIAGNRIVINFIGALYCSIRRYPGAIEKYGTIIYPIDISSSNSTKEQALDLGASILEKLNSAGIASPPYSLDIKLDINTIIDSPHGLMSSNAWYLQPGNKISLNNLPDVLARDLNDGSNAAYIDVRQVQLDYGKGEVTYSCRKGFDPAVIISRTKGPDGGAPGGSIGGIGNGYDSVIGIGGMGKTSEDMIMVHLDWYVGIVGAGETITYYFDYPTAYTLMPYVASGLAFKDETHYVAAVGAEPHDGYIILLYKNTESYDYDPGVVYMYIMLFPNMSNHCISVYS